MKTDVLQGVEQDSAVQPEVQQSTYQEAIKTLLASGAKKITGLKVKMLILLKKIIMIWYHLLFQVRLKVL